MVGVFYDEIGWHVSDRMIKVIVETCIHYKGMSKVGRVDEIY